MVTLSVTRSRVAMVLNGAAENLEESGWDAARNSICAAIDRAAGFVKPGIDMAAENLTLQAWAALAAYLLRYEQIHEDQIIRWERAPYRIEADVLRALRNAAKAVCAS